MALTDFQSLVDNLVRDESGEIMTADRDAAIELAVVRYSTDRPVQAVEEVVSTGGVLLDLPAGWEFGFSRIVGLALMDGDEEIPIAGTVEQGLAGNRIRLEGTLAAGTAVLVRYTVKHRIDSGTDTVPIKDREAVCGWAAALLLESLSSLYSGSRQPAINADAVDWQSKGRDYAQRAKTLRRSYLDHLGINPKRVVPHGVVVDLDTTGTLGQPPLIRRGQHR